MVKQKKAQAAFEYLTTYGWAILTVVIAIGTLSYFGFLNPSNLLPNACDFGKQLKCTEYMITSDGDVKLMLRNNFGKDIDITAVSGIEIGVGSVVLPPTIGVGTTEELSMVLDNDDRRKKGEKQEVKLIINFTRAPAGTYAEHTISGLVFVTVQ